MQTPVIEQQLPTRVDDKVVHRRWKVDTEHAARTFGMDHERLVREATEMATHFPRWVLTVAAGRTLHRCVRCGGMLVFEGGVRCVQCCKAAGKQPLEVRPAWFGLVPPIGIDGLPSIVRKVERKPVPQHVFGERPGLGKFLLVPLVAAYPSPFPKIPVEVFYLPEFAQLCPTDQVSHAFHMLGGGRMCLFASGEWAPQMTAREVLQQRAYAHVIKFLNYANGKSDAFAKVS